jgi:hypothetical protein
MRQAKPDDVFSFITLRELDEQLVAIEPYLGKSVDSPQQICFPSPWMW